MTDDQADRRYQVVVNEQDQHSLWPADRRVPAGWRPEGFTGTEDACRDHIDEVWTDIAPAGLRRRG